MFTCIMWASDFRRKGNYKSPRMWAYRIPGSRTFFCSFSISLIPAILMEDFSSLEYNGINITLLYLISKILKSNELHFLTLLGGEYPYWPACEDHWEAREHENHDARPLSGWSHFGMLWFCFNHVLNWFKS